ncbi:hypothetical protein [Dactylosporangium sp. CA-092794]|uniref:hypothetical protein n=1 Tax=Dactylosporangium sp. CA-092794 TaxID=3239929 RepID=UPI003D909793
MSHRRARLLTERLGAESDPAAASALAGRRAALDRAYRRQRQDLLELEVDVASRRIATGTLTLERP